MGPEWLLLVDPIHRRDGPRAKKLIGGTSDSRRSRSEAKATASAQLHNVKKERTR
jgi:hypothetical protein